MNDKFHPHTMLETYRANANDFMRQQATEFRSMSPSDQREFLFWMMANMAISQAAIVDCLPDPKEEPKETRQ